MLHRREILQIGCSSALGVGLADVLSRRAIANPRTSRIKSVVLAFLSGGGSHIDMFDPKPEASATKGEFDPIATSIPGVTFSEKMPQLAARAHQLAIVRSMSHGDNRHLSGSHNLLTGAIQPFRGDSNQAKSLNRDDWPSYGSTVSYFRPRDDRLPSQVTVPNPLIEGVLVWPGQHSGILDPKHDPFVLKHDPNSADYQVSGLSLIEGLNADRLTGRRQLVEQIDRRFDTLNASSEGLKYGDQRSLAFSMLTSSGLKNALDINAEPDDVRDRYGRHKYGQTLLLARRLVELEIPVIQCNMGHVQMWDTHVDHFPRLQTMLPALDTGLSTFLDELNERGLLDQTLVLCVGEFGRTPQISPLANETVPGRHHWAPAYTAIFAGGGILPGQVIGKTDNIGAYPLTMPFHPNDIGATIYSYLGIDPDSIIHDRFDRPRELNAGKVMDVLTTGVAT
ncbi:MAG: DUF1501 domain-containing protein [Planctomycetota bacterium]|nr:DUF1501 domain-containing protein [Planctomycetota bacterium]MDA1213037.1 DUF1501 domain-containing protein [Planctomycetota bacterium]